MATITISKLSAAHHSVVDAIRLFFNEGHPVAIHLLACAAHEVLYNLASRQGIKSIIKDYIPGIILANHKEISSKKEWSDTLNQYYNFFKHADRDPDFIIDFDPEITDIFIFDSILMFDNLCLKSKTRYVEKYVTALYTCYYMSKCPDIEKAVSGITQHKHFIKDFANPCDIREYRECIDELDRIVTTLI